MRELLALPSVSQFSLFLVRNTTGCLFFLCFIFLCVSVFHFHLSYDEYLTEIVSHPLRIGGESSFPFSVFAEVFFSYNDTSIGSLSSSTDTRWRIRSEAFLSMVYLGFVLFMGTVLIKVSSFILGFMLICLWEVDNKYFEDGFAGSSSMWMAGYLRSRLTELWYFFLCPTCLSFS